MERAHRDGVLTAASLMVTGAAANDAVDRARTMPDLGVGLHLVLIEGHPAQPPELVPDLVDGEGLFRADMVRSAMAMAFRPRVRRQLFAEVEAQFAAFAATGLRLDHVNAHKHFHLHPVIASAMIAAGAKYGMTAARAPVEPRDILMAIEPGNPPRRDPAGPWARLVQRRLRRARFTVPDQVFGLAWSGAITPDRLRGLIERCPPGLTEIYTHPATGPYPGSAIGYDYEAELAALIDPLAKQAIARENIVLGAFRQFAEG